MGIKHSTTKAGGEIGYASEWNANHVIDGDVDFNGFGATNSTFLNWELIGKYNVSGSGSQDITGFSGDFKMIKIIWESVGSEANVMSATFNDDYDTTHYASRYIQAGGSFAYETGATARVIMAEQGTTEGSAGEAIISVVKRGSNNNHYMSMMIEGDHLNNACGVSGYWKKNENITKITIRVSAGTFTGTIWAYGLK